MSQRSAPSLKARLQARGPRRLERVKDPVVPTPSPPLAIYQPQEIAAMAVGLLILKQVEETGGTRLFERSIHDAIKRLTSHANAEQMMRLEVEAHEILHWLVRGDDLPLELEAFRYRNDGALEYDPTADIPTLVREACELGVDLKIQYFSKRRAEMNTRVISPKAIAAEEYVRAHCHARGEERIFRMERIRKAVPIGIAQMRHPWYEQALSDAVEEAERREDEAISFNLSLAFDSGDAPKHETKSPKKPAKNTPESDQAKSETETSTVKAEKGKTKPLKSKAKEELKLEPAPKPDYRAMATSKARENDENEEPKEHQPLDATQLSLLD